MKISKVEIRNFRLLKDVRLDLENDLSLVIGKNNCGKTSLLLLLERFLGKGTSTFAYEDLNLDVGRALAEWLTSDGAEHNRPKQVKIQMLLFITYDKSDDLSAVGDTILMDLDPNNSTIVLSFEYGADADAVDRIREDFIGENQRRKKVKIDPISAVDFLSQEHGKFFKTKRKSVLFDLENSSPNFEHYTDLDKEKIKLDRVIRFSAIGARRDVSNKESDNTLSAQSSGEYDRIVATNGELEEVERFRDSLVKADRDLDGVYNKLFGSVLNDVAQFGGIQKDESQIKIVSALRSSRLLKDNTIVKYASGHDGHDLPENHNGLGYLNLISMIFDLRGVMQDFSGTAEAPPANINLLFIEEPEAHTHPQLQYVFIKNIKELLSRSCNPVGRPAFQLQTILSTHSSHIVSESSFDDIKYLRRNDGQVQALNLKDLKKKYSDRPDWFRFLKQYLTVHRSELFFADKAIFIEGDTERILMPSMITKADQDCLIRELEAGTDLSLPLQSQNISIVEVGNYFRTFEKFVQFIGLKCLVTTDLDGGRKVPVVDDEGNPKQNKDGSQKYKIEICTTDDATLTTNETLKQFFPVTQGIGPIQFQDLKNLPFEKKAFLAEKGSWIEHKEGTLRVAFQTEETNSKDAKYQARSFEDAFLHVNYDLLSDSCKGDDGNLKEDHPFPSLTNKHLKTFLADRNTYEMAKNGIGSKPSFAIEVLLNSQEKSKTVKPHEGLELEEKNHIHLFGNWNTPEYIQAGLIWLRKN
ncbi:MAG: ATP-dependent endonuclease [Pseudoruegeria sp.]